MEGMLDDRHRFAPLDTGRVLESIENMPQQLLEIRKLKISIPKKEYKNVIVAGMGGSSLPAHLFRALLGNTLTAPLALHQSYGLPAYANQDSLVICASYSGSTEEVMSAYDEALERKITPVVFTSGGKLAEYAKKEGVPLVQYATDANPSKTPRLGLLYGLYGLMRILEAAGVVAKSPSFEDISRPVERANRAFGMEKPEVQNPAKQLARTLEGKFPLLISTQSLEGNLHVLQNQLNETAKSLAAYHVLPELNHHLLEGFAHPPKAKKLLHAIFFPQAEDSERLKARLALTMEALEKQGIQYSMFQFSEGTPLAQGMELLMFGSYVTFYMAMLAQINPAHTPFVDWFKSELEKSG